MDIKNKKILILGGEGFIGRNLASYLTLFFKCYSCGIEKSIFKKRADEFLKINPYVESIENDFDVIIHLIDNKINIDEFEKNEEALIKNINLNNKNHLIIFSSAIIYANPNSEYGQRKIKMENFYKKYCFENNIKLTILRLFNIYGPYQLPERQGSLIVNIFYNYLTNRKTEINDMNAKRDFIYSFDVAKIIKRIIEKEEGGFFDLATGEMTSIREVLIKIEKKIIKDKLKIIDKKNKETVISPEAKNILKKEIDFENMEKGLMETFDFYKNNLNSINNE